MLKYWRFLQVWELRVQQVSTDSTVQAMSRRKEKLPDKLKQPTLPPYELQQLKDFLADHHDVFSLEEGERGKTDIVQFEIDTGMLLLKNNLPEECLLLLGRR